MFSVLSLKERKFIKTNWNINETEVNGSLSVRVKGGFWVHIDWNTLLLSLQEILLIEFVSMLDVLSLQEAELIKTYRNINEAEVDGGLGVGVKSRFRINVNWNSC